MFGDLRMCVDEVLGARPTLETSIGSALQDTYVPNPFSILTFTDRVQKFCDQQDLSFNTRLNSTGEAVLEIFWLPDMPASSMLRVSMAR